MSDDLAAIHKWLNKNLVSMVLIYWHLDEKGNSKGKPFVFASSGFVMTFGEVWFLVTAGHTLQELDELIARPDVKVVASFIVDSLGSQALHRGSFPFTYDADDEKRRYVYEDGLDFGLIALNPNDRRLLEANGIQTVAIENWINQDIDRCIGFILVGIPVDLVSLEGPGQLPTVNIGTFSHYVARLTTLPPGAKQTKYERFVGDLGKPVDFPSGIKGTSGGPILGFFYDDEGAMRYWIVALQSHCLNKRYIFGCPVRLFGEFLLGGLPGVDELPD